MRSSSRGGSFPGTPPHEVCRDSEAVLTPAPEARSWSTLLRRYVKFNAVGAVGIGVQLAVLALVKTGLGIDYMIATAIAVECAVLNNFFWHEKWTWDDRPSAHVLEMLGRLLRFNLTTGVASIAGNLFFMRLLVGHAGMHYMAANLITIAACSLFNFLVSELFVFRLRSASD